VHGMLSFHISDPFANMISVDADFINTCVQYRARMKAENRTPLVYQHYAFSKPTIHDSAYEWLGQGRALTYVDHGRFTHRFEESTDLPWTRVAAEFDRLVFK
jgi:hypothetical protein